MNRGNNTESTNRGTSLFKKVEGVLMYNNKVRNEHLKRNLDRYSQYNGEFNPMIGQYYEIDKNRPLYNLTDGKSLFDYTHDYTSLYSKAITKEYFNDNIEKEFYKVRNLSNGEIQPWKGLYDDYITYVGKVYGKDGYGRFVQFMNSLLSPEYIENALRLTEVGIVKDINVIASIQGAVVTNINNFSGTDTRLGLITNQMYAYTLMEGAKFNSARKSNMKYLTPTLFNVYGNNESNVRELSDILQIGENEKRLPEGIGGDVHIIHDFNNDYLTDNGGIQYLDEVLENSKEYYNKYPNLKVYQYINGTNMENGGTYVEFTDKDGDVILDKGKLDKFNYNDIDVLSEFKENTKSVPIYGRYTETDKSGKLIPIDENEKSDDESQQKSKIYTNSLEQTTALQPKVDAEGKPNDNSLISKTLNMFASHKINTLVSRFHTSSDGPDGVSTEKSFIDTAKSQYGNSHGRNLLKLDANENMKTNGWENPYCRVWTHHHQYSQVKNLIRPFIKEDGDGNERFMTVGETQSMNYRSRSIREIDDNNSYADGGDKYLGDNTVLNDNGFVNITPPLIGDKYDITKCMFSIENLAWKDVKNLSDDPSSSGYYLSKEQRGVNGGRVMWFPPYDLKFNESVNVQWNPNEFIGRGESVYTYKNTNRTGTLSFTLLIDHPSIIDNLGDFGEGMGTEKNLENDILRFFAGCQMLENGKEESEEKLIPNWKPITEQVNNPGSLTFYVYYPNNYSGCMCTIPDKKNSDMQFIDYKNGILFTEYDDFWWKYLFSGIVCTLDEDEDLFVGYEMSDKGLSVLDEYKDNKEIYDKLVNSKEKYTSDNPIERQSCVYKKDSVLKGADFKKGDFTYNYLVDLDLRQNYGAEYPKHASYSDTHSSNLNSKLNKEKHKGADCSFAEFIIATILLQANKTIDNVNEIKTYGKYLAYAIKCGANIDNINSIMDKLSKITEYTSIVIEGGATSQDIDNSKMLARRRANSIKQFIINHFNGEKLKATYNLPEDKWVIKDDNVGIVSSTAGASTEEAKLSRYSKVTINFNGPSYNSYSQEFDGYLMTKEKKRTEDEKIKSWDSLYIRLCEYNEVFGKLNEYDNTLKKVIKTSLDEKNISTYNEDYESEDKLHDLNMEIMNLTNDEEKLFNYDWLVQAYSIGDNETNDSFINKLKEYLHINDEISEEISSKIQELNLANEKLKIEEEKLWDLYDKLMDYQNMYNGSMEKLDITKLADHEVEEDADGDIDTSVLQTSLNVVKNYPNEIKKIQDNIIEQEGKVDIEYENVDRINEEIITLTEDEFYEKYPIILELEDKITEKKEEIKIHEELVKTNEDSYKSFENDLSDKLEEFKTLVSKKRQKKQKIEKISKQILDIEYDYNIAFNSYLSECKTVNKLNNDLDKLIREKNGYYRESDIRVSLDTSIWYFKSYIGKNEISGDDIYVYNTFPLDDKTEQGYKTEYNFIKSYLDYCIITILDSQDINDKEYASKYLENKNSDLKLLLQLSEMYYNQITANSIDYEIRDEFKDFKEVLFKINGFKERYEDCEKCKDEYNKLKKEIEDSDDNENEKEIKLQEIEDDYNQCVIESTSEISNLLIRFMYDESVVTINNGATQLKKDEEEANRLKEEQEQANSIAEKNKAEEEAKKKIKNEFNDNIIAYSKIKSAYKNNRYEDEGQYFSKLKKDDPFIFKQIKEKVKYFNPAFHSMSPEGFNARLTFLHQCTRQGHTLEASNNNSYAQSAGNLAFGRMPVCVLKIGDFINTRILISNMSINYDNQWDLNPEGVGVQPMIARVSLSITILGGQSLEAPISKLQNAVSFNYYANTGVYDNRADMAYTQLDDTTGKYGTVYRRTWAPYPKTVEEPISQVVKSGEPEKPKEVEAQVEQEKRESTKLLKGDE